MSTQASMIEMVKIYIFPVFFLDYKNLFFLK